MKHICRQTTGTQRNIIKNLTEADKAAKLTPQVRDTQETQEPAGGITMQTTTENTRAQT